MSQATFPGLTDDDIAESLRTIDRQRTTKLVLAIIGLVVALAVTFFAVAVGYNTELDSTKDVPQQAQP